MKVTKSLIILSAVGLLAACETNSDGSITDGGLDGGTLQDGLANVWVDPDGCQHWYVDDGIEGYMSPRLNRDGTPVCQDTRGEIILKDGTTIPAEQEPLPSA